MLANQCLMDLSAICLGLKVALHTCIWTLSRVSKRIAWIKYPSLRVSILKYPSNYIGDKPRERRELHMLSVKSKRLVGATHNQWRMSVKCHLVICSSI